ncbi:MAG TPA: HD domain-containing phosphohydrolase [Solirubrobacterales bacterium]|nr:HD domain-containing phosphohydrolase [Solirubrobacterales bacterium]
MSSPPHSGDPSPAADPAHGSGGGTLSEAAETRLRGEPLLDGLEQHIPGAREHADATAAYAFAVAVEIGLDREECELIRETARLHEVGKLYLPAWLLAEPRGQLSASEREQLESHESLGQKVALGAGIPEQASAWILHAAEHFDGTGPGGLAGEGIPLAARIIRVSCAYETLLHEQPAGAPDEPRHAALAWLRAAGGAELDPALVEALARVVQRAAHPPHRR